MSKVSIALNIASGTSLQTPEQRRRRDQSVWTDVHGVLDPLRLLLIPISLNFAVSDLHIGIGGLIDSVSISLDTLELHR